LGAEKLGKPAKLSRNPDVGQWSGASNNHPDAAEAKYGPALKYYNIRIFIVCEFLGMYEEEL
jgi:hypothetical protein